MPPATSAAPGCPAACRSDGYDRAARARHASRPGRPDDPLDPARWLNPLSATPHQQRLTQLLVAQLHRAHLAGQPVGQLVLIVERWHCERYLPHQVEIVMCGLCGNTVMLGGDLATGSDDQSFQLPELAVQWLTGHGWIEHPSSWYCGGHANRLSGQ